MDIKDWLPEFKVSSESDKDLMSYFLRTKYLSDIIESDKWMVLGRKGTGKTAIFEYLKSSDYEYINNYNVVPLDFSDYPWPVHRLYREAMEGELTAYQKSWHYLFIVHGISRLIEVIEKSDNPLPRDLKRVKRLLEKIFGSPTPTLRDVIKSKIARVDSLKGPGMSFDSIDFSTGEISFEEISQSAQLKERLKTNSFTLLNYLEEEFSKYLNEHKILIILDHLDENWLEDGIQEYSKILINLINTCKSINNSYENKFKVVPFLRTDIYETLRFNDKNKIYQDSATNITWDENSLNDMLYQRIFNYKPRDISLKKHDANSVFEVSYVRHGATPFKHIIRRSFLRPRDIIVYMNKIRDIHTSSKNGLYTSKDLYDAEKEFSLSMYNEILDEWINQKPEINDILLVLQNIGYQTFGYQTFEDKYISIFKDHTSTNAKEAIRFLFHNSILGQKVNANWEYYCGNLYMNIDFEKLFHVNSALKSRLMLTEGRAE